MQTSKELYHFTITEKKLIFASDSTSNIEIEELVFFTHKSNSFQNQIDLVLNLLKWTWLFYLYGTHPISYSFLYLTFTKMGSWLPN